MFERYSGHSKTDVYGRRHQQVAGAAGGLQGGKTADKKLARGLGSSEKKMGYRMLDPSSKRITSGKKKAKKEAIR